MEDLTLFKMVMDLHFFFLGESEIFDALYKLHNLVDEQIRGNKPKKGDAAD